MNRIVINADLGRQKISRHIYGHFAEHLGRCIYEGLWVGENSDIPNTRGFRNDVVAALKKLNIPNLRWPGGCFADTYHWMDGIGPREKRPSIVNVHWGGCTENNHFGTHEFLDLCEQLGTMPYIAGNVGSGTVQGDGRVAGVHHHAWREPDGKPAAQERPRGPWPLTFWGVGNENWGCGGNMRPQYYADLYRQYASYCRHFTPGEKLYKVACGLDRRMERNRHARLPPLHGRPERALLHRSRRRGRRRARPPTSRPTSGSSRCRRPPTSRAFIKRTAAIMDRYDPQKRIGIVMDEWGTWFDVEPGTNPGFLYQQNTIRDALVAGLSLNIFNNHADRVHMANIAQTVNVLQAMVLTEGAKMLLTPTYHVFEMYKVHQDATLLPTEVQGEGYVPAADVTGAAGATGYSQLNDGAAGERLGVARFGREDSRQPLQSAP